MIKLHFNCIQLCNNKFSYYSQLLNVFKFVENESHDIILNVHNCQFKIINGGRLPEYKIKYVNICKNKNDLRLIITAQNIKNTKIPKLKNKQLVQKVIKKRPNLKTKLDYNRQYIIGVDLNVYKKFIVVSNGDYFEYYENIFDDFMEYLIQNQITHIFFESLTKECKNDNDFMKFYRESWAKLFQIVHKNDFNIIAYKINKYFPSSQLCNNCGYQNKKIKKDLSIREWTCPKCKIHMDRDINAAKNICDEGVRNLKLFNNVVV